MSQNLLIRPADKSDITTIEQLARRIWPATYSNILTPDQLNYMLDYFYVPSALENQMDNLGHHFIISELNEEPVGFASWSLTDKNGTYKLHKLYIDTSLQGKGIGKKLVDYIEEKYGLTFTDNDAETLSGYIIGYHETIPRQKERIIIDDYEFDIINVSDTRIEMVKVKKLK